MARARADIKREFTTNFMSNSFMQALYSFADGSVFETVLSIVSFENILFDILSYSIYTLETLYDNHRAQIDIAIYEQKSGTSRWYRNMALAFQYGFSLLTDDDQFDNTGYTVDQVAASQIVKYCSVKESTESNKLTIKIAGEAAGELSPLTTEQLESFSEYMGEIKYAGVKLNVVNNPADKLHLNMQVYRDVLVIDSTGMSITKGTFPVQDAVKAYMKALPFDGELVINDLIATLRAVDGVRNVNVLLASSSAFDTVTDTYESMTAINVQTIPDAGYFEIDNFDDVSYVV